MLHEDLLNNSAVFLPKVWGSGVGSDVELDTYITFTLYLVTNVIDG